MCYIKIIAPDTRVIAMKNGWNFMLSSLNKHIKYTLCQMVLLVTRMWKNAMTKALRGGMGYLAHASREIRVCYGGQTWQQTADMVVEARDWEITSQTKSRESKIEKARVFKLSAPTPSDILHLARPHLLHLPTQLYQPGTKNSNVESTGAHLT